MKTIRILTSILLLNLFQFCFAQDCDINLGEFIKGLDYKLDTLNETDFNLVESKYHSHDLKNVSPVSEADFVKIYPNIFRKIENGYEFRSWDGRRIEVVNRDTLEKPKDFHQYKFEGNYCNFALIYTTGYESWSYLFVDLSDGTTFSIGGKPHTNNCELIYSTSNYYGEGMFEVVDVINKKILSLYFDLWDAEKVINIGKEYYLKLRFFGQCNNPIQYYKITIL